MPHEYVVVKVGKKIYRVCCNDLRRVYYVTKRKRPQIPSFSQKKSLS